MALFTSQRGTGLQGLGSSLRLPDVWQQSAIQHLQGGCDVVVDAPTGAGKTYIFELVMQSGIEGQAVYTVPTRALANDKLLEWRERGWDVGIATGDIAENLQAPIIVATLETQKANLLLGQGPRLLVVDEYQMLGDTHRGVNYELAIAMAPASTQLLLLSGSVGNPSHAVEWMNRLGRSCRLVSHRERPVPLEEVDVKSLPNNLPSSVKGKWPRIIGRALKAGMGPILAFAPRRNAAEALARQLATFLPEDDPLALTAEQKKVAGDALTRLLRARIAFHHSGLDYRQRAGLVEPLAKSGQLRVVVATMGLSSGINFSLRSVLVTGREYRAGDRHHQLSPHELLQMFGRAGRRGLDKRGYVIVAPGTPRINEARQMQLRRSPQADWPSLLRVMHLAAQRGADPKRAAHTVAERFYTRKTIELGLERIKTTQGEREEKVGAVIHQTVVEIRNSADEWERRRAPRKTTLGQAKVHTRRGWIDALQVSHVLTGLGVGSLCRLEPGKNGRYGRELPLARLGVKPEEGELVLTRWTHRELRKLQPQKRIARLNWTLDRLESRVLPLLPAMTKGGELDKLDERGGIVYARLDYQNAPVFAHLDTHGVALLDPPEQERRIAYSLSYPGGGEVEHAPQRLSPAEVWRDLGLIEADGRPTRRGVLFSFFQNGEGLALAAALEEDSYPLEELVRDLANLRAGYRFSEQEDFSGRLGVICRATYKNAHYPGYLHKGLPPHYGDGAAETLARLEANPRRKSELTNDELRSGDIERARLEWRSLLNHCAHAPELDWERWLDFRRLAGQMLETLPRTPQFASLPELTAEQKQRHKSFLRFE